MISYGICAKNLKDKMKTLGMMLICYAYGRKLKLFFKWGFLKFKLIVLVIIITLSQKIISISKLQDTNNDQKYSSIGTVIKIRGMHVRN